MPPNQMSKIEYPGQGHEDDYYNSSMGGRTPSPGAPLSHGYQLEDTPSYHSNAPGAPLHIPMGPGRVHTPSDNLLPQPTVSIPRFSCSAT